MRRLYAATKYQHNTRLFIHGCRIFTEGHLHHVALSRPAFDKTNASTIRQRILKDVKERYRHATDFIEQPDCMEV